MTFHAIDASTFLSPLATWLTAQAARCPQGLTFTIEGNGDQFESTTGEVTGVWTATPPSPIASTPLDTYSAGVGYLVNWKTDTYLSGRLLRGKTFVVPIIRSFFDTDGTLLDGALATMRTEATALVTDTLGNFAIWQRPRKAKAADGSRKAVTARGGGHATVVLAQIPDRGAFLTSRRS